MAPHGSACFAKLIARQNTEKHFMAGTALVWLRNDLRLADNPALHAALASGMDVTCVHIDESDPQLRPRGAASRWWLHHSLNALEVELANLGVEFETLVGPAGRTLEAAVRSHAVKRVYWNRRYAPAERQVDAAMKSRLKAHGLEAQSFPGNALVEPFDIATKQGQPYGVFTPFWNSLREREIARPMSRPAPIRNPRPPRAVDTDYRPPAWSRKLAPHWSAGETAAIARLKAFLDDALAAYPDGRDFPAREVGSRLSPHLAFGEISARQVWHAATARAHAVPAHAAAVEKFLSELAWRDFNIHQLYYRPDIATHPMQEKFADLKWRSSKADLVAWQMGVTGVQLVDAGMHELWETGFMHNRVRMVVASFLTKNLLLDWRLGEQWFWDTLVDADMANNPGNWQWVAGCGLDAAPYFRVFNPLTQAQRFDPDGAYVRRWAPHPRPAIVDLKASRERALQAFHAI